MIAHCVVALLYFGVLHEELAHDPAVRDELWKLLAAAQYGYAEREEAMFIVRADDGSLSFVRWESKGVPHQSQWHAPIPRGAVAIAHTHPNWIPRPSSTDVETALRSNLPVYVVTRMRIMKTFGGETSQVAKGEWR